MAGLGQIAGRSLSMMNTEPQVHHDFRFNLDLKKKKKGIRGPF